MSGFQQLLGAILTLAVAAAVVVGAGFLAHLTWIVFSWAWGLL